MGRIQIAGSFLCLLAVMIFLDTENLCLYFLAAAAMHECGHLLAIRLCGGAVRLFRLTACGGVIRYALPRRSPGREAVIALGGCALGGILAGAAYFLGQPLLCGASTILTLFNLLPIATLDGGRALRAAFGEGAALDLLSHFTLGLLLCVGAVVALRWHGFGLLFIGAALALQQQMGLRLRANRGMIETCRRI